MRKKYVWSLSLVSLFAAAAFAAQERPNVVWLTTEDNSACWYRLYNQEHGAPMPNVERLAKEGLVFNNVYSCGPVCSVARSTIISGCYGPRTGAQYHRKIKPVDLPDGLKPFPAYLRDAGYYTSNNSKTDDNCSIGKKEPWDESSATASYRNRKPGQPFFHVQNWMTTHESKLFKDLPEGAETVVDPDDVKLFPYHPDTPTFRKKYAQYLSLQSQVDAQMGELIDPLEKDGLLDDTFIFHYGDHGGVLVEMRRALQQKIKALPDVGFFPEPVFLRESGGAGVRSPMIAYWPGKDDQQKKHKYLYWELYECNKPNCGVRYGKWKGVVTDTRKGLDVELYDVSADESERREKMKTDYKQQIQWCDSLFWLAGGF